MNQTRRRFLTLAATAVAASLTESNLRNAHAGSPTQPSTEREYRGSNLAGWVVVVGDGNYVPPGEPPVTMDDIETAHLADQSILRANVRQRSRIAAHNITYHQLRDDGAFGFVHTCQYQFRLPYMPATSNTGLNGQTVEGGISLWDGRATRMKYEVLFQWIVNPYWHFGELRSWTGTTERKWQPVGDLSVDTSWHQLRLVADFERGTSSMSIDGHLYPSGIGRSRGPSEWGTEIAASIQAEIISIDPGAAEQGAIHETEIRNWVWTWERASTCRVFLPTVAATR